MGDAVTLCSAGCADRGTCKRAEGHPSLPRVYLLVTGREGKCVNFMPREVQP